MDKRSLVIDETLAEMERKVLAAKANLLMLDAQARDQLQRINELSDIVSSIEETQPSGFCFDRLVELVEEARVAQEQTVDGLQQ